jgi:hypothetical protein
MTAVVRRRTQARQTAAALTPLARASGCTTAASALVHGGDHVVRESKGPRDGSPSALPARRARPARAASMRASHAPLARQRQQLALRRRARGGCIPS